MFSRFYNREKFARRIKWNISVNDAIEKYGSVMNLVEELNKDRLIESKPFLVHTHFVIKKAKENIVGFFDV